MDGIIQIDDAYWGGERHGGKRGRGAPHKIPFVAAWLRQGERQSTDIVCNPFDKAAFISVLDELRFLTNESDPEIFEPKLVKICSKVGVAVVFEPAPKGCPVSGATKWLSSGKALLMLSLRYKKNDHLWFTFFHEAAHLLLHGKKMLFIEEDGNSLNDKHEQEANQYACNFLIPQKYAKQLKTISRTKDAVKTFASKLGIAPGIVVGRMQKEGYLPYTHLNGLKITYHWNFDDKA